MKEFQELLFEKKTSGKENMVNVDDVEHWQKSFRAIHFPLYFS